MRRTRLVHALDLLTARSGAVHVVREALVEAREPQLGLGMDVVARRMEVREGRMADHVHASASSKRVAIWGTPALLA
jgi:hypothetical protein